MLTDSLTFCHIHNLACLSICVLLHFSAFMQHIRCNHLAEHDSLFACPLKYLQEELF